MAKITLFPAWRLCRAPRSAAALLSALLAAAGCADRRADNPALSAPYTAPAPANPGAFARFTAPAAGSSGGSAQIQALNRAAALAMQQNYPYFILIQQPAFSAGKADARRDPVLAVSYGRQPDGFGDASGEYGPPGLGISLSPAIFTAFRHKRAEMEAQWLVYMLKAPTKQAALAAFAGPPPADTALIYRAGAPAASPAVLRLR